MKFLNTFINNHVSSIFLYIFVVFLLIVKNNSNESFNNVDNDFSNLNPSFNFDINKFHDDEEVISFIESTKEGLNKHHSSFQNRKNLINSENRNNQNLLSSPIAVNQMSYTIPNLIQNIDQLNASKLIFTHAPNMATPMPIQTSPVNRITNQLLNTPILMNSIVRKPLISNNPLEIHFPTVDLNSLSQSTKNIECIVKEGYLFYLKPNIVKISGFSGNMGFNKNSFKVYQVKVIMNNSYIQVLLDGSSEIMRINLLDIQGVRRSSSDSRCFNLFDNLNQIHRFCHIQNLIQNSCDNWVEDIIKFKSFCSVNTNFMGNSQINIPNSPQIGLVFGGDIFGFNQNAKSIFDFNRNKNIQNSLSKNSDCNKNEKKENDKKENKSDHENKKKHRHRNKKSKEDNEHNHNHNHNLNVNTNSNSNTNKNSNNNINQNNIGKNQNSDGSNNNTFVNTPNNYKKTNDNQSETNYTQNDVNNNNSTNINQNINSNENSKNNFNNNSSISNTNTNNQSNKSDDDDSGSKKNDNKVNNTNILGSETNNSKNHNANFTTNNSTYNRSREAIEKCFSKDPDTMIQFYNKLKSSNLRYSNYDLSSSTYCFICCKTKFDASDRNLKCCYERCNINLSKTLHVSLTCINKHAEMLKHKNYLPKDTYPGLPGSSDSLLLNDPDKMKVNYNKFNQCFTDDIKKMSMYNKNILKNKKDMIYIETTPESFCKNCCKVEFELDPIGKRCCEERCDIEKRNIREVSIYCIIPHSNMLKFEDYINKRKNSYY